MKTLRWLLTDLFIAVFLLSCDPGGDSKTTRLPVIDKVTALSQHFVEVTFESTAPEAATETINYIIDGPQAPLAVENVLLHPNRRAVILQTTAQAAVEYRLYTVKGKDQGISFTGSDQAEPGVEAAMALNATQVAVKFSQTVPIAFATEAVYHITSPDLTIVDAQLHDSPDTVLLSTSPQEAHRYQLEARSLIDETYILLNPAQSTAYFTGNQKAAKPDDTNTGGGAPDDELPRVTGAVSTGNTRVLVSFSEAMDDHAVVPAHYSIVQESTLPEVGALAVLGAEFVDEQRKAVRLTTLSQNEVTYRVKVINVYDLAGNALAGLNRIQGFVIDPTSAVFAGTPPAAGQIVDSDQDGISDHEEQRGWVVVIRGTDGDIENRQVSSDPAEYDTDGDGLSDAEEKLLHTDPRDADTDDDMLSDALEWNEVYSNPILQDTDQDLLPDGLEFVFFKTSPILMDSDGDQLDDDEEIGLSNRNPRIADLPQPRIRIGNVNLTLDTRFSYTDTLGQSVQTTESVGSSLSQSDSVQYATSDEDATTIAIEASQKLTISKKPSFSVGFKQGFSYGHTSSFSRSSTNETAQAYEESLTLNESFDQSRSVSREIVGADMLVDVTVENIGDIAFTINNFELTALQQNATNRNRFLPIASLKPGSDLSLNIGPSGTLSEKGPFVFSADQIFPAQVEDLMKNPRGLIVKLSNFNVTDETGRNFAFTSQEVFDRTASISIDFGDGAVERYRVATASTFNQQGLAKGITMAYALGDILNLKNRDVIRDSANLTADTEAAGDDIQVVPVGGEAEAGQIIIRAGHNGELDTTPAGDDRIGGSGYETVPIDLEINGETRQVTILSRIKEVETGFVDDPATAFDETKQFWVVFASRDLDPAEDFEDMVLRAGEHYALAYVQDKDDDRVYAREEFLYGSSDRNANTDGCFDDDPDTPVFEGSCDHGSYDTLTDFAEIKEGWTVNVERRPSRHVYSDPVQPDSDGDRLVDHEEQRCALDPRQRDTDLDGLNDYEELTGFDVTTTAGGLLHTVPVYDGSVILDGGDGMASTSAAGDDIQVVPLNSALRAGEIVIEPGADGVLDSTPAGDDFTAVEHAVLASCEPPAGFVVSGYATQPDNPDTDGDGIVDGAERNLGINPNDPRDGAQYRDADGDGVADFFENEGFQTRINGTLITVYSDPFDPDTDHDFMPDLLEHMLGSDPQKGDSDNDGINDYDEFKLGQTCITSGVYPCQTFTYTQYAAFLDYCADADTCSFDPSASQQVGTNPMHRDTDADGINDFTEVNGYQVTILDQTYRVFPDPLNPNSDTDGWGDGTELSRGTDATLADSDGDGTVDNVEAARGRNPLVPDRRITLRYSFLKIDSDCDPLIDFLNTGIDEIPGYDEGDFRWNFQYQDPTMTEPFPKLGWNNTNFTKAIGSGSTESIDQSINEQFIADFDETFKLAGWVAEDDTLFGAPVIDGLFEFEKTYTVNEQLTTETSVFKTTDPGANVSATCFGFARTTGDWTVEATVTVD